MSEFRHWIEPDRRVLVPQLLDYLRVVHAAGGEMLPTQKNAELFFWWGLERSAAEDPTFVATEDGAIVGWTLWGRTPNPGGADYDGVPCACWGTYVIPARRRSQVATELRSHALRHGVAHGITRFTGVAYDEAGKRSAESAWFVPVGTQVEYRVPVLAGVACG